VITVCKREAAAPGILARHVFADTRARARARARRASAHAAMRASPSAGSLGQERRAGRYSIMATDCVKHPPRPRGSYSPRVRESRD